MAAAYKESNLQIMEDFNLFAEQVGIILLASDVNILGFKLNSITALFSVNQIDSLFDFCEKNSKYHIVSMIAPYVYRNTLVSGNHLYHLADGDASSNLLCHPYLNNSLELYHEHSQQKLAAKIAEINRREKIKFSL